MIYYPPQAQACSLCPIQNSQFSPRPICPTCPTRPTIQNSEFKIHNSLRPPLAQACSLCPIQNSEFIIPFAARTLTHPITPIAPIIARVAHTPLFPLLPQSLPTNSTTAAFSPF